MNIKPRGETYTLESRAVIPRDLNRLWNELTEISKTSAKTNPVSHKLDKITPYTATGRKLPRYKMVLWKRM